MISKRAAQLRVFFHKDFLDHTVVGNLAFTFRIFGHSTSADSLEDYVNKDQEDRATAIKSFQHWMSNSASHRAFISAHDARHAMLKSVPGGDDLVRDLAPVDELRRGYEGLADAHTLDGAIDCHAGICDILFREISVLDNLRENVELYTYMHALIEERLHQHMKLMELLCNSGSELMAGRPISGISFWDGASTES